MKYRRRIYYSAAQRKMNGNFVRIAVLEERSESADQKQSW